MTSYLGFDSLSKKTFKQFIKSSVDNNTIIPEEIIKRFETGTDGKVINENGISYKLSPTIGTNRFKDSKAYLNSYYLDIFVNYIIHHIFTYEIMPCPATGSYIIPMGSKIIDHKGYSTYESVNRGTLESYITNTNDSYELDNILIDSIYDVSDFLTQLGKYDFTHNNLSVSEVLVDEELDGILTYKVKDFDNSYIEFNDLEIGVDLPIFDIHTEEPGIECVDSDYYTILTSKCCRILGSSLRSKRKHGIHIDIYTLILSIALHPNVSKNIMNLPKFNRFMNYIFIEDDLVKINEMMRSGKINTFTMTELTCFLIGGVALLFEPDIKIKRFMSGYA